MIEFPFEIAGRTFPVTCVSMGNPHCVVFVERATDDWVLQLGPQIEVDPRFPRKTNVEFVEVISRSEVKQRTWERAVVRLGPVAPVHQRCVSPACYRDAPIARFSITWSVATCD